MTAARKSGTTRLQWLTILILLVIASLAGLGLISLRQDRHAAEEDARLLADALSDSLAIECATSADEAIQEYSAHMEDARNAALRVAYGETNDPPELQLVPLEILSNQPRVQVPLRDLQRFPPATSKPAPQPPEWMLNAPHEWMEKLEAAERSAREGDTAEARAGLEAVEQSNIRPLQSLARLRLAELKDAEPAEVVARLRSVAGNSPDDLTPAGLAVADLALLQALKIAPPDAVASLIQPILSRSTFHPSFLTGRLFSLLEQRARADGGDLATRVEAAKAVWHLEENTQAIVANWRNVHEMRTGVFRVPSETGAFFLFCNKSPYVETNAVVNPDSTTTNVVTGNDWLLEIVPDSIVDAALRRASGELGQRWPRYLSAEIEMAGRRFGATPWEPGTTHAWEGLPALVTNAASFHTAAGTCSLAVKVWLANPGLLHSKRRARAMIFGLLIVGAAAIAVFGAWQLQKNLNAQIRLNEQKSNFVSSVSHELRAPIASVRLMAEGLERGKVKDAKKQAEYFQFIGQECRRLSSLIENVLDFSRIEQGRKQYEFEPTDLLALMRETVSLMEPYASEREVRLTLEIPTLGAGLSTLDLVADGRALQQALINLIDNAIKHSPKGETVTVSLEVQRTVPLSPQPGENPPKASFTLSTPEPVERSGVSPSLPDAGGRRGTGRGGAPLSNSLPGRLSRGERAGGGAPVHGERPGVRGGSALNSQPSTLRLHISDHGPGIPLEEQEKIFERFHRLGSELRRETQGVGIGLSIVKHIVEAHGGRVTVHSVPDQGSQFTIELQIAKSETRNPKPE